MNQEPTQVVTEQGDLGLGLYNITEEEKEQMKKKQKEDKDR